VGQFGFGDGTFIGHVVYLSIITPQLPFVFNVGVGASVDSEDCAMSREVVALLRRLPDL
jgi:hypothetical protein